ncbi:transcriptional regulator CadC [Mesorhizobium sp. B1-1-7]|nr:transcriptional regulator CadC [Mesorhizobium sp. B1-1-7]
MCFELDRQRAELRGPEGAVIRIRLRSLELLKVFATNPGRVLSKQELMEAVWPDIHVGENSLFQSIRELRTALGDEQRQVIKLMSGRGYLFAAAVSGGAEMDAPGPAHTAIGTETENEPAPGRRDSGMPRRAALVAMAGLGVTALVAAMWRPRLFTGSPVTVSVMLMAAATDDPLAARMAADVTRDLTDGLAKIETIRVMLPSGVAQSADYVLSSELEKTETTWNLRARMTEPATSAVMWTTSLSIDRTGADAQLQQTRLTAGMGHPLALRINALLKAGEHAAEGSPTGTAKVAIEQATASINHTTLERFRAALAILEKALADDPDNVDLQVALAAFQLRGVQMAWFPAAERETVENSVGAIMARALRARPDYIPVLETQCRFLSATNQFVESLVACGKALAHDPWDGIALYLVGLSQVFLGRFDDALASFKQADGFDTPRVARWTWALGVGWTYLLMGRAEEALPWLQRSIAITPGTGRTHMALAAAYQQLGRADDARATMVAAMELWPGSTARNAPPPTKNCSAIYLKAYERVLRLMVAAGLPE